MKELKVIYVSNDDNINDKKIDLLNRLTIEEKISQLGTGAGSIDRLNIPGYQW